MSFTSMNQSFASFLFCMSISFMHLLLFHSHSHHLEVIFLQAENKLLQLCNSWIKPLLLLEPTGEIKILEQKAWIQTLNDCMKFPSKPKLGLSLLDRPLVPLGLNVTGEPKEDAEALLALPEWQRLIETGNYVPGTTCVVLPNACWRSSSQNIQSLVNGVAASNCVLLKRA